MSQAGGANGGGGAAAGPLAAAPAAAAAAGHGKILGEDCKWVRRGTQVLNIS